MAKRRKFLLYLILSMGGLIIITAVAMPLLPLTAIEPAVERKLSEVLGRRVTVDSLRLNLIGDAYFTITGMTVQEDPAFDEEVFLRADYVRADIDLLQYLRSRQIRFEAITVKSAQIHLVRNADGSWNWTTLGKHLSEQDAVSLFVSRVMDGLLSGELSQASLKKIKIENASVRLTDRKTSAAPDILYKSISLNASLAPVGEGDSESASHARGEFTAQSEEDGEAEMFRATFPFDLKIERSAAATLLVGGSIGPGPLETKNLSVGSFSINGQISAERSAPLTGNGHLSTSEMLIRPINLSERVAGALGVDQIGDMNPGTLVGGLESEFQISQGAVETTGLRIREIDGLGDAAAENGRFKIDSGLSVNYTATITLSIDATSRVKATSTMLGIIATVLETDDRISVPVNIDGDMRNPRIYVDVSRIF